MPKRRTSNPAGNLPLYLNPEGLKPDERVKCFLTARCALRQMGSLIERNEKIPVLLRHDRSGCKCLWFTQPRNKRTTYL